MNSSAAHNPPDGMHSSRVDPPEVTTVGITTRGMIAGITGGTTAEATAEVATGETTGMVAVAVAAGTDWMRPRLQAMLTGQN